MATRKYEVHTNKDGAIHVTSRFRTAAWAHACFGPKGLAKWAKGLDADLVEAKACPCGLQPGQFRKASGQTWADPQYREKIQAEMFEQPKPAKRRPTKKAPDPKPAPEPKPAKKTRKAAKPGKPKKAAAKKAKPKKAGKAGAGEGRIRAFLRKFGPPE